MAFFLAVLAGIGIALQSSLSGQLAKLIGHPFLATFVLYGVSTLCALLILPVLNINIPSLKTAASIPVHLWILGSAISIVALTIVYYVMPTIGINKTLIGVIAGQILVSVMASHFGWFSLPQDIISYQKLFGCLLVFAGVFLIQVKF